MEVTLWRSTGGTWEGFDDYNVSQWTRQDGKVARVSLASVKMAGGLAEAFVDIELTGVHEADERRIEQAAIVARDELEKQGGPFAPWRHHG